MKPSARRCDSKSWGLTFKILYRNGFFVAYKSIAWCFMRLCTLWCILLQPSILLFIVSVVCLEHNAKIRLRRRLPALTHPESRSARWLHHKSSFAIRSSLVECLRSMRDLHSFLQNTLLVYAKPHFNVYAILAFTLMLFYRLSYFSVKPCRCQTSISGWKTISLTQLLFFSSCNNTCSWLESCAYRSCIINACVFLLSEIIYVQSILKFF